MRDLVLCSLGDFLLHCFRGFRVITEVALFGPVSRMCRNAPLFFLARLFCVFVSLCLISTKPHVICFRAGVILEDDTKHEFDAVVLATGFHVSPLICFLSLCLSPSHAHTTNKTNEQHIGTFMRWLDPAITQRVEQHVRSWKNDVHESYLGGSGRPSRLHPQLFFVGFNVRLMSRCFVSLMRLCACVVLIVAVLCSGLDWSAARVRARGDTAG